MGHVCASPNLNLTAAVVGTVITEVRHKSQSERLERERQGERKYIASGPEEALTLRDILFPPKRSPPQSLLLLSFFLLSAGAPTQSNTNIEFTSFLWLWQSDYSGSFTGSCGSLIARHSFILYTLKQYSPDHRK